MKRFFALLLTLPLLLITPACTTANKAAYKTTQAVSATADIGLRVWADYVSAQKAAGTPVSLEKEIRAKQAWNAFQDARDAVIKAGIAYSHAKAASDDVAMLEAELNAAVAAMAAAQGDFLSLLQSFGVKL